jgi:uncharacterized protein (DUF2345 family)
MDTGLGFIQPLFFIGVVENRDDPRAEGRVQVRAFGVHGSNRDIATEDLPWATLIIGNHDTNFTPPPLNAWVFGFFIDGRDAQQPMILGLIPSQILAPIDPSVTGWGAVPLENYDRLSQGARPRDVGLGPMSRLATSEFVDETYVAAQNANRRTEIPIAGGCARRSYTPGGNAGSPAVERNEDEGQQGQQPRRNVPASEQARIDSLDNDQEFQTELRRLQTQYGVTREQVYGIIAGESSYNPSVINRYGYAGFFQFGQPALNDINRRFGTSYTTSQIARFSPAQQLRVYNQYLSRWGYRNSSGLGIIQAAPAFANRPGNTVVYPVGSSAWAANPGWRGSDGRITVDSINAYYNRRNPPPREGQESPPEPQGPPEPTPAQQRQARIDQIRARIAEIDAEVARLGNDPPDNAARERLQAEKRQLEEELAALEPPNDPNDPAPYQGYADVPPEAECISTWSEPTSAYGAQYPYNRVIETAAGHSIELDDTPGAERIMIWHTSGSYIQISPTSVSHKSTTDSFHIHEANHHVYIRGNNMVTIDGDMHVLVKGNKVEEIQGDYRQIVHGSTMMGAARRMEIQGGDRADVRGGALGLDSNVENLQIRTSRNITFESGETINLLSKNVRIGASENLSLSSDRNLMLGAAEGLHLKPSGNLYLNPEQSLFLRAESGTISMQSRGSIRMNAEGFVALKSGSTMYLKADSNMILGSDSTINVNSGDLLSLKSGGSMFLNNTGGDLNLKSAGELRIQSVSGANLKGQTVNIEGEESVDVKGSGGPVSIEADGGLNLRAGQDARLLGGNNVHIRGTTVFIDDIISLSNGGATSASPADSATDADVKQELDASFMSDPLGEGEFGGAQPIAEQAQQPERPTPATSAASDSPPEPPSPSIDGNIITEPFFGAR